MKKNTLLLLPFLFALSLFGCDSDIHASYDTVQAEKIELTSKGESVAVLQAEQSLDGKVVVTVKDMKGKLITKFEGE